MLPVWFITHCKACVVCTLCKTRRQAVVGRGETPATILYIGEGPGKSEDMLGLPFIGTSGKLFDEMRKDAAIDGYSYFITNTVLCRPTDEKDGENRAPKPEESEACFTKVLSICILVHPKVIVYVGEVAKRFLAKRLNKEYRKVQFFHILHPAYVLRSGGKCSPLYLHNVRLLADIKRDLIESGYDG